MSLHPSSFEFVNPTPGQRGDMAEVRGGFKALAELVPDSPDKTHALRLLRTAAMWANVAITRDADGAPR